MKKLQQQKGFTLVELAIVLTIIGLLIGGILKGQQLMQNARISSTVAQINGFESATTAFRDAYGMLPGDLVDARNKISGCTACGDGNGNGKIGARDWDMLQYQGTDTPTDEGNETLLYWYELQAAGYISGVSDEYVSAPTASTAISFGGAIPASRLGGGYWVGNNSNHTGADTEALAVGRPTGSYYTLLGSVLATTATPTSLANGVSTGLGADTTATRLALTPAVAAQIDRKIDDGLPGTGQVQAFGVTNSCYGATGTGYQEGVVSKDCGLYIRIQR